MTTKFTTKTSITLQWAPSSSEVVPVTGYILEINDFTETLSSRMLSDIMTGNWFVALDASGHPEITSTSITGLTTGKEYNFRYKSINFNGESDYSVVYSQYACVNPTLPSSPHAVTVTNGAIRISWIAPIDNGGCEITGYVIKRNDGQGGNIFTSVHSAQTSSHPEITEFTVTDLPSVSVVQIKFIISVLTQFNPTIGVDSLPSDTFLVADIPSAPLNQPSSGSSTGANTLDIII